MGWRASLVLMPLCLWSLAACGGQVAMPTDPTWTRDIAPLVFRSCTPCHRPGQPAPFTLLDYASARKKCTQMAEMSELRQMPPWLMSHGSFADDRRLSATEIDLLQRWAELGAPRGDGPEPLPPAFPGEWQRHPPDLVVTAPDVVTVPADGPNVFCNLVIPLEMRSMRYVEATLIRPDSPAVHHAVLAVDETRGSRRLDAADPGPGWAGMAVGGAVPPDGNFVGWTPGKSVRVAPPGQAWRLRPGQDLVLQLHLVPTGKVERVQPRIGFWFTEVAPTVHPYPIVLWNDRIDLPPGTRDFVLQDHLVVPVPVTLLRVYPHAHYLCRRMRAWLELPDGSTRDLFRIDTWDFDWQDDYTFAPPVAVPAGAKLAFEYVYDNSEDNPANPNRPPRHVRFGQASADEMGTLTIQAEVAEGAPRLQLADACYVRDLEKAPLDAGLLCKLAGLRRERGLPAEALALATRAQELQPTLAEPCYEIGLCHERAGRLADAEAAYVAALERDPQHAGTNLQLGGLLARSQRTAGAVHCFETALASLPNLPLLHCNLGTAKFSLGDLGAAEVCYRRALALDPGYVNAMFLLGRVLVEQRRPAEATQALQRVLQLQPGHPGAAAALRELGG